MSAVELSPAETRRDDAPLVFTQALRSDRWRWWWPLLGLLAASAWLVTAVAAMAWLVGLALIIEATTGQPLPAELDMEQDAFYVAPAGFAVTNLILAAGIVVAVTATAASGVRPGLATSVAGRMRWGLLGWGALVSVVALLAVGFLPEMVGLVESAPIELDLPPDWIWFAAVFLLTTPLQAAGEEYFFRGWLSQWIGSWFRWRWVAVLAPMLVTSTLFAMAHGDQDFWLFSDRLVFGIVASLLVWLTGGLELAIALHVANNLIALGFTLATGTMAEMMEETDIGAVDGAWSIGSTVLVGALLLGIAHRRRPAREISGPLG